MLVIRLARTGRTKYPTYRIVAAEKARATTGKFVAVLGHYNPHTKDVTVKVDEAQKFLDNGAQPTPRVVKLLKDAGVKLPKWVVEASTDKTKTIRHSDKLRKNQPAPEVEEVVEEAPVEEAPAEELAVEEPAVEAEVAAEEAAADETEA